MSDANTNPPQETSKEVEIAKIGYRQAVTVAIISSLSTFLVTLVGGYFALVKHGDSSAPVTNQRFITIRAIKSVPQKDPRKFRLSIEVNGYTYSYPTRDIWADPSDLSLPISFPIVNDKKYEVYFSAWQRQGNVERHFLPQPVDIIEFTGKIESRTSTMVYSLAVQYEIHE